MSSCPGEETLRLLGDDTLGDATYAAIEEHVEGCLDCKAALERLASEGHRSPVCLPDRGQSPQVPGFEIQRELGRGALSVVYRPWRAEPGSPCGIEDRSKRPVLGLA